MHQAALSIGVFCTRLYIRNRTGGSDPTFAQENQGIPGQDAGDTGSSGESQTVAFERCGKNEGHNRKRFFILLCSAMWATSIRNPDSRG
jgi:hypothetical protein